MNKLLLSLIFLLGLTCPSWAVVSSTISQNIYACNGTNTTWAYTFPIILTSDIQVYTIDQYGNPTQQTSNFSVNTVTQSVTYPVSGTPCASPNQILLLRVQPLTQLVAASNQGPAPSPVVMGMSDKLTMMVQQEDAKINRAVLAPIGSTSSSGYALPSPLANAAIGWDPTATFLTNQTSQALLPTSSPTFAGLTLTGFGGILKATGGGTIGIATSGSDYSTSSSVETLTNKTFDTAGIGNVFKLNGTTLAQTSVTGTGLKLATSTGTLISGDCIKADASGNLIDNGAGCSGGSGMTYPSSAGITVTNGSAWATSIPSTTLTVISGNVGIGTTGPSAELDVEGTISPVVFFGRGTDYNVGIGLLTPGKQLDVNGTVRATYLSGNFSSNVGMGTTVPAGALDVEGTINTIFYGNSTSNVGIGSLSPGQALDVQGTVRALHFSGIQVGDVPALSYAPETSGTSILYGNGIGGFANATVGMGLSFSGGALTATSPGFVPTNIQVFTSSGTWTKPSGVSSVYVKVIGGGGAGGNAGIHASGAGGGGGGGGGGYSEGVIAVTGNVTVTIGSTNSFAGSTTLQATAGSAGSNGVSGSGGLGGAGGAGGVGSNGTINLTGSTGSDGGAGNATNTGPGGAGGNSAFGPGGASQGAVADASNCTGTGYVGRGYGGGGGGAAGGAGSSCSGGAGDVGAVIVYY